MICSLEKLYEGSFSKSSSLNSCSVRHLTMDYYKYGDRKSSTRPWVFFKKKNSGIYDTGLNFWPLVLGFRSDFWRNISSVIPSVFWNVSQALCQLALIVMGFLRFFSPLERKSCCHCLLQLCLNISKAVTRSRQDKSKKRQNSSEHLCEHREAALWQKIIAAIHWVTLSLV